MANRRSALLLTGLTLAVWALAPSASCQEAPGPPLPTASSLWEDITTFETFHQIRLTAEQALDWAAPSPCRPPSRPSGATMIRPP